MPKAKQLSEDDELERALRAAYKESNSKQSTKKTTKKKQPIKKSPVKAKAKAKAKTISKSRKEESEDDDDDEEEEEEEEDGDDDDDDDGSDDDGSDGSEDNGEDDDDSDDGKRKKAPVKRKAAAQKKPAAKKAKTSKTATKKVQKKGKKKKSKMKAKSKSKDSSKESIGPEKLKKMSRLDRLEEARKAFKWWEVKDLPPGINWRKLEHPGVLFAPAYKPHGVPLRYEGEDVALTPEQEEIVSFYAAIPEDGPQLGNPKTRAVFQRNFFEDFKSVLPAGHVVKKFQSCDFTLIKSHLSMERDLRKAATDEEKRIKKEDRDQIALRNSYALIDGRIEKMGNYNMEPPGLFRGRGEHPLTGKLKKRCFSESVNINVSEDACPPKAHLPGHAWGSIRHDPSVTWLCGWEENVQQSTKYVMLSASSSFKGKSDMEKYTKAIRLKSCIDKIRKDYTKKIHSKDAMEKQIGTAMWVIDILALRVGGEKSEDEADTVGCCSLRVEHLTFAEEGTYEIELEFLGKDSMLFKQNVNFEKYGELGLKVFENLKTFCRKKGSTDDVFEDLNPTILNEHLSSLMSGLSAKVFRTYNASETLQKELPTAESLEGLSVQDKVLRYNAANRQVAILCNHQRTVSKSMETTLENYVEKLEVTKRQNRELLEWKAMLKKGKGSKIPLKDDDQDIVEKCNNMLKKALQMKQNAKTTDEKLAATKAEADSREAIKSDMKRRLLEAHMFKSTPSVEKVESRIASWEDKIRKMEIDLRNKDENKEVALGTSKINYMDPRISVAWCKRCEVPIDKIFAKALRDKFNWAMAVPPEWQF